MSVAEVMCKLWKTVRKKYNGVSDFDYHITDLRKTVSKSACLQTRCWFTSFFIVRPMK